MLRSLLLAAALAASGASLAQTAPAPKAKARAKPKAKTPPPAPADTAPAAAPSEPAPAPATPTAAPAAAAAPATPPAPVFDQEEFRRAVMEEVRKELQKTKDEVKQETAWVEQDSQARVQDSEAVENLKQRVNLFQPHGYLRMRGEFFNDMNLGRTGTDPSGHYLFPGPFIGSPPGQSQSDANFRFRFEPTLEVSEDLSIHFQADMLDNVLLGSDPSTDVYLDPFTPLQVMASGRGGVPVNVKRVWGRVNTALGELDFGRMGYHWGMGLLHNDGNCLDCDFGDTYDRVSFAPREFKGHNFTVMLDLLDKGAGSSGDKGELGRTVDLDTLDDGYRIAVQATRVDSPEEIKRKLDAQQWVINYGLLADYRTQQWDTPVTATVNSVPRQDVVRRAAKIYQPDVFVSLKRKKWRFDAEIASTIGSVGTHQFSDLPPGAITEATIQQALTQPVTFFQWGGAFQTDLALFAGDSVLFGIEGGAASGDKGAYGFGARPWRSGNGAAQPVSPGEPAFRTTAPGDIDGTHLDFSDLSHTHGRINNFMFNRSFNVDMILFRNLISTVTSAWYIKPSMRYRPTGRKTGGGDDTGFELLLSAMYSQAWYDENTPGLSKPLGLEFNAGITYDTSDHFHAGLAYGVLLPFGGMRNGPNSSNPSVAHAVRMLLAIPF